MPMPALFRRSLAAIPLLLPLGCVALPVERDNYFDGGANTRYIVTGVPDTVNSVGEDFELTATTDPPPGSDVGIAANIVVGHSVLAVVGTNHFRFRARPTIGLLPVRAVIRLSILGVTDGPVLDVPVILRQRPQSVTLSCVSEAPCGTMAPNAERILRFLLRDSAAVAVNLPAGDFRYGEVTSRAEGVVEVVGRPTPSDIVVRARTAGSTWIVFQTAAGIADSLSVTVLP